MKKFGLTILLFLLMVSISQSIHISNVAASEDSSSNAQIMVKMQVLNSYNEDITDLCSDAFQIGIFAPVTYGGKSGYAFGNSNMSSIRVSSDKLVFNNTNGWTQVVDVYWPNDESSITLYVVHFNVELIRELLAAANSFPTRRTTRSVEKITVNLREKCIIEDG